MQLLNWNITATQMIDDAVKIDAQDAVEEPASVGSGGDDWEWGLATRMRVATRRRSRMCYVKLIVAKFMPFELHFRMLRILSRDVVDTMLTLVRAGVVRSTAILAVGSEMAEFTTDSAF
jgi:hypothetical protein